MVLSTQKGVPRSKLMKDQITVIYCSDATKRRRRAYTLQTLKKGMNQQRYFSGLVQDHLSARSHEKGSQWNMRNCCRCHVSMTIFITIVTYIWLLSLLSPILISSKL